jgi:hypothetical protein
MVSSLSQSCHSLACNKNANRSHRTHVFFHLRKVNVNDGLERPITFEPLER